MLDAILQFIWLPYELWKKSNEESLVGASRSDNLSERFWYWFGVVFTGVIFALGIIGWIVYDKFFK